MNISHLFIVRPVATALIMIAIVTGLYLVLKVNAVLCFWLAYILTRPLGASCGDLLSQPVSDGGLGLGTTLTSIVFLAVILGLVWFLTIERGRTVEPDLGGR